MVKDLAPCFITYSAATGACHKAKQWVKALELLVEMWQYGLEPNVVIYNTAISACEKAKPSQKTLELIEEMQQKGLAALSFDASAGTPALCDHLQRSDQPMQRWEYARVRLAAP